MKYVPKGPLQKFCVAPLAGAWVEIEYRCKDNDNCERSLPSRERGLKYLLIPMILNHLFVAPLAGAWVEMIREMLEKDPSITVAPLAGAWVEITSLIY